MEPAVESLLADTLISPSPHAHFSAHPPIPVPLDRNVYTRPALQTPRLAAWLRGHNICPKSQD